MMIVDEENMNKTYDEPHQDIILEHLTSDMIFPQTEKKYSEEASRKNATDRYGQGKRQSKSKQNLKIEIPSDELNEGNQKFDPEKFFDQNKAKAPVIPLSQEMFTVELRSSLERLSASKASERVVRDPTQRDSPVKAGLKQEYQEIPEQDDS